MSNNKVATFWLVLVLLLIVIIIASSAILWNRRSTIQTLEITLPSQTPVRGEIYINGAVANAGIYSWKTGDTVDSIIQMAGGTTDGADLNAINLSVPGKEKKPTSQKIDINLAEDWLLEALPEIGKTRAQAIILYRTQNGPFHNIQEITRVEGLGTPIFERIKNLITVGQ